MASRRKRAEDFTPPSEVQPEPEVDLDAEEAHDREGNRITTESAADIVEHVYARMKLGRPFVD